jgi:hypothetical protein
VNDVEYNEDKHPCLKRDSNPRYQRPSDQGSDHVATGTGLSVVVLQNIIKLWLRFSLIIIQSQIS